MSFLCVGVWSVISNFAPSPLPCTQTKGRVILITNYGDIDIELWSKECPKTCRNFVQLCLEGEGRDLSSRVLSPPQTLSHVQTHTQATMTASFSIASFAIS